MYGLEGGSHPILKSWWEIEGLVQVVEGGWVSHPILKSWFEVETTVLSDLVSSPNLILGCDPLPPRSVL